ncbi:hypothetical protein BOTBODRAFT_238835 [Botryobasidium botryosum FD-172 SS1]|uniref:Uncharacterized protein n=1 Tax=Botryobasidium botryosum (strain FD-172 SS1) TaxID=930990 RepID=A0A067MYV4_BOTB1|nr:hypothetical protein BOTBODRAFT_238835 [Botryobasidium botryosum FD-172 SS1]
MRSRRSPPITSTGSTFALARGTLGYPDDSLIFKNSSQSFLPPPFASVRVTFEGVHELPSDMDLSSAFFLARCAFSLS